MVLQRLSCKIPAWSIDSRFGPDRRSMTEDISRNKDESSEVQVLVLCLPRPDRMGGPTSTWGHFRPSNTLRARQTRGKSPYQTGHSTSSSALYLYKHGSKHIPEGRVRAPPALSISVSLCLLLWPVPQPSPRYSRRNNKQNTPEWNEYCRQKEAQLPPYRESCRLGAAPSAHLCV